MRFGPWQPLDHAGALAPAGPGVLQLRADRLFALPRGKSAMVFYAAAPELAAYVGGAEGRAALAAAAAAGACWIRFGSSAEPDRDLDRLLRQFDERFGARPPGHG